MTKAHTKKPTRTQGAKHEPERRSREGIEQAAAARLGAAIVSKSIPVGRLRSQAERLLGSAIVAYAGARALAPSALAVPSTRCR